MALSGSSPARLASLGIRSMKASSTISSRAATARSACGGNSLPVGLSGLTTTTTSASPLRDLATTATS